MGSLLSTTGTGSTTTTPTMPKQQNNQSGATQSGLSNYGSLIDELSSGVLSSNDGQYVKGQSLETVFGNPTGNNVYDISTSYGDLNLENPLQVSGFTSQYGTSALEQAMLNSGMSVSQLMNALGLGG